MPKIPTELKRKLKRKNPRCKACLGKGKNSKGGICIPCNGSGKRKSNYIPDPRVLLMPNIPKPLHGLNPRTILGNTWWNKTKAKAFKETRNHCKGCGVHKDKAEIKKGLEGHEQYRVNYKTGRMTYLNTIPLCYCCHNYVHYGRLEMLLLSKKITREHYYRILDYGDMTLMIWGLSKKIDNIPDRIPWNNWRLILKGKAYKPLFKSFKEWEEHYILPENRQLDAKKVVKELKKVSRSLKQK